MVRNSRGVPRRSLREFRDDAAWRPRDVASGGRMEDMSSPATHPLRDGRTAASALVTALRGQRPERTPVWFMRQAGRSLPEYRALRVGTAMLDACLDPELASEITLQPVRRHGVDAAVFFSDIVIPLRLAGVPVEIVAGPRTRARLADPLGIRHPAPAPDRSGRARADPRGCRAHGRRTRHDSAHRVRRCAVHARVVPRRRRTVEGPAARAQPDGVRPVRRGRSCSTGAPTCRAPSCGRRSRPAPARCSSSTRGSARCRGQRLPAPRRAALASDPVRASRAGHADHPLRGRQRRRARSDGRHRRGCGRRRLAHPARRGLATARRRRGRAGQHRPGAADCAVGGAARTRARRAGARPVRAGARRQPRSRRSAGDRPRRADPHREPRPRSLGRRVPV